MSLCIVCKSIPFRKLITRDYEAIENDGFRFNLVGRTSPRFSDHLPWNERRCTLAELVSRAKMCRLCEFVLLSIKDEEWYMRNTIEFVAWEEAKKAISRNLMIWMDLSIHRYSNPYFLVSLGDPRGRKTLGLSLDLRKTIGSSLKSPIKNVVFRETIHPNTLNLMQLWLDECDNSHSKCSHLRTRLVPLPTRVLDLGALPESSKMLDKCINWRELFQGENCNLLQTSHGQTGRYAALSYCWGASLPSTTTTTNLRAHQSAISFDTLPKTLQDAIMIVRWMGIRYIWIDCLCILQDCKADWEKEAARMADVYSNAYLTLAASRAEHCREGFLGLRNVGSPICIDVEDHEGSFEVYLQPSRWLPYTRPNPLDSRAWAAQENLLSNRVLSFKEEEMTWRCDQVHATEEIHQGINDHIASGRFEQIAKSLTHDTSRGFGTDFWIDFVDSYSARQATYETDTFPAISGIVQKIQQLTGDVYCAGLWKQHFLDGLLWEPKFKPSSPETVEGNSRAPRRRHRWIAPSWSWASVNGQIEHWLDFSEGEYCSRLEECSSVPDGSDPFGALKEGFARLTGPVAIITYVQAEDKVTPGVNKHCTIQLGNGTLTKGYVLFDFTHHVSCEVLMVKLNRGICIEKVEHTTNTYVRIGIVYLTVVRHNDDNVICDASYTPSATGGWRGLVTSDHVPPRTIVLI